jgi:hypothetical protein
MHVARRWVVTTIIGAASALGAVLVARAGQSPRRYGFPSSTTPPISLPPSAEGQQRYDERYADPTQAAPDGASAPPPADAPPAAADDPPR